jgi:UMF1 family MFS transporter
MEKNNPRLINAWSSYDWANSVYNLIVTTAIFPIYYSNVTKEAFGGDIVPFFGIQIESSVLFTYAISLSFLVIVLCSPILSGIADYTGSKKRFMQFFTYLGAASCIGLYFFDGPNIEYGIMCSVLASVGYAGSLVFYNGFLPEVTTADRMDSVSARGFTFGYIGSVILLMICLAMIMKPGTFGFSGAGSATKFCFLLVGIWWIGFAQIAFYYLKDKPTGNKFTSKVLGMGIKELKKVINAVKERKTMKRFLFSFFFYSMGVLTVMLLAPLFAQKEVGIDSIEMIGVVLILQILAIFGAYFFSWVSSKRGSRFAISSILLIWMALCVTCYFLEAKTGFYILAAILGFGMGGVQSISRSTYARLIPKSTKDTASYFSFFDITEKLAIVIGSFAFGFINQVTGSMRNSMVFMTVFFIIGFVILQMTDLETDMKKIADEEEFDNPWDDVVEDLLDD